MNRTGKWNLRIKILIGLWFLTAPFWFGDPIPVLAAEPIVLDGVFADWAGKANIADASGDAKKDERDITGFWWADNVAESRFEWKVDRVSSQKKVTYVLHVDANNNGDFDDNADREVEVVYEPRKKDSHVDVKVRYGDTRNTISQTKKNDWGESEEEGGRHVEFMATFADLGIVPGEAIRFYVTASKGKSEEDRAPDTGNIQWSVVNVFGYPLLAGFMIGASLFIWRFRGRSSWTKA
jgi:hypothetical protein